MKYKIGQVIFAVLNKKNHVYPMQIIEIITKKTLTGEVVNYLLQGGPDKTSTVFLEQIDGEVFETAEIARTELINRATKQINKLIESATQKSKEWYSIEAGPTTIDDLPEFNSAKQDSTENVIVLEDGTVAKIKLPSALTG